MKVNEQWLMSYLTDLENLDATLATLSHKEVNLYAKHLITLSFFLSLAQTRLTGRLTSELGTAISGSASEDTFELVDTPSTESN